MGDAYRCDISLKRLAITNPSNIRITNGTLTRFTAVYVILDIKVSITCISRRLSVIETSHSHQSNPIIGFDCSLRVCPRGDDPLTTAETAQEIQLLRCTATSSSGGKLVLYFDGNPSANVPVDASTAVLKRALEDIPNIESVHVTFSEGTVLCRNDGVDNIVSITFASNFGPL